MRFNPEAYLGFTLFVAFIASSDAFQITPNSRLVTVHHKTHHRNNLIQSSFGSKLEYFQHRGHWIVLNAKDDSGEDEEIENPYADPNYPDVSFYLLV